MIKNDELQFRDLMLDIETMGTGSDSSIISIGALEFDIETGKTGKEFYRNIDLQSCIDLGLTVDASTIMWWLKQNEQARRDLTESPCINIQNALSDFSEFCNNNYYVWGNSPRFDCGILQNAYNKCRLIIPWDYKKERCVRTLVSLNPEIKNQFSYVGVAHNAVQDCYNQVSYCTKIWNSLYNK